MSLPWYRWFPSDFAGDAHVQMMSPLARLAYRGLLDLSWQVGPLANPLGALSSLGVSPDLWDEIKACWDEGPGGWTQGRLEDERVAAVARRDRAVAGGKAKAAAQAEYKQGASRPQAERKQCLKPAIQNQNQNQTAAATQQQLSARGDETRAIGFRAAAGNISQGGGA